MVIFVWMKNIYSSAWSFPNTYIRKFNYDYIHRGKCSNDQVSHHWLLDKPRKTNGYDRSFAFPYIRLFTQTLAWLAYHITPLAKCWWKVIGSTPFGSSLNSFFWIYLSFTGWNCISLSHVTCDELSKQLVSASTALILTTSRLNSVFVTLGKINTWSLVLEFHCVIIQVHVGLQITCLLLWLALGHLCSVLLDNDQLQQGFGQ